MITETCKYPIFINNNFYPCGKCPNCLKMKKFNWTVRAVHEAMTESNRLFCTLTYSQENLPKNPVTIPENNRDAGGTLKKDDFTKFIKRLRKFISKKYNTKIKIFGCGEYGTGENENYGSFRPHYHIIIYGLNNQLLSENELSKIWKLGIVEIDKEPFVDINAMAYVAGYVDKKINSISTKEHFEDNGRERPFQCMSHGLGKNHAMNTLNGWIESLKIGYNNTRINVPKYYIDKVFEKEGIKVKLINKTITATETDNGFSTSEKKSIQYKIIKNPNGELTKKILKKLDEIKLLNYKKIKIKYNLNEKEYNELIKKHKNKINERNKKLLDEWTELNEFGKNNFIKNHEKTNYIIKNKLYNPDEKMTINKTLKPLIYKQLKNAKKSNEKTLSKNFQKSRDKIERDEYITELLNKYI